jgi:hypothetical protein
MLFRATSNKKTNPHCFALDSKTHTCVTSRDMHYTTLQDMIGSWDHDEHILISAKSKIHSDVILLEFETFGSL